MLLLSNWELIRSQLEVEQTSPLASWFSVVPRDFAVFTFQPKPSKSWIPGSKMQFYIVGHSLHSTCPIWQARAYFALLDSLRTRLLLELYSLAMWDWHCTSWVPHIVMVEHLYTTVMILSSIAKWTCSHAPTGTYYSLYMHTHAADAGQFSQR